MDDPTDVEAAVGDESDDAPAPEIDHETRLAELARLGRVDYDRQRRAAAQELGVRASTLDAEVERRRPRAGRESGGLLLADPDPWELPVTTCELLDGMAGAIGRHVVMSPTARDAAALWGAMTWIVDALHVLPILAIQSPQRRCGKSTLLIVLRYLTRRALLAASISRAAIYRVVDRCAPTLLLDEVDAWVRGDEEMRGIIDAGHTRDTASVIRCHPETLEPEEFSVFAPRALAGIGGLAPTIEDRSVIVSLRRRRRDEQVEALRQDRIAPELEILPALAMRWANDHLGMIRGADPVVPPELHDRAADNWRPLLAVAELAGAEWADRARRAAVELTLERADDETVAVTLLADVAAILERQGGRALSATIVAELGEQIDRPWPEFRRGSPITVRQLARQLTPFSVRPRTIRVGTARGKGYLLDDFSDPLSRYCPSVTPCHRTGDAGSSADAPVTGVSRVTDRSVTPSTDVTHQIDPEPSDDAGCHGVTDGMPPERGWRRVRL